MDTNANILHGNVPILRIQMCEIRDIAIKPPTIRGNHTKKQKVLILNNDYNLIPGILECFSSKSEIF